LILAQFRSLRRVLGERRKTKSRAMSEIRRHSKANGRQLGARALEGCHAATKGFRGSRASLRRSNFRRCGPGNRMGGRQSPAQCSAVLEGLRVVWIEGVLHDV